MAYQFNPFTGTFDITTPPVTPGLPLTRAFVPQISTWTVVNGTGTTQTEQTAASGLTKILTHRSPIGDGGTGQRITGLSRTAPATPYRLVAGLYPSGLPVQYPASYVGWTDGTKLVTIGTVPSSAGAGLLLQVARWTNVTTVSTVPYQIATYAVMNPGGPVFFGIDNDGTNLTFMVGPDSVHMNPVYTETIAAFMTTVPSLFFGNNSGELPTTNYVYSSLFEWDEDGLNRTLNNVNFG